MQVASTLKAVPFGHQLSFGGSGISSTTQGLPSGSWFLQGYARLCAWMIFLLPLFKVSDNQICTKFKNMTKEYT